MDRFDGVDQYKRPDDQTLRVLSQCDAKIRLNSIPDKFKSFLAGVQSVYTIITEQEKPKIVIAPWRGAAPIVWALEAIAEHENNTNFPLVVALPIGTSITLHDTNSPRGLEDSEKLRVVTEYMNTLDQLYGDELRSEHFSQYKTQGGILLLDEAQKGGTISRAAEIIHNLMTDTFHWTAPLSIVMAHSNLGKPRKITRRAEDLLSNKYGVTHKVTFPLPFMDVPQLLPIIVRQDPKERTEAQYRQWQLLEMIDNSNAHTAVNSLVHSILSTQDAPVGVL